MNNYTPGPWHVRPDKKEYHNAPLLVWGPQGPGYGTIAEASNYKYEAEANARLIAAAPELLEALQAILKDLDEADMPITLTEYKDFPKVKDARSAVAKARGES